ncbi:MAG TPA: hypothetical protein VGO62_09420 [Myxococcota bacterium]|jgi:hypothetical protein
MMMIVPVALALAAASPGLAAPTPVDEVKQLDALMPAILRPSPKLDPVLASKSDLEQAISAWGVSAKDLPGIVARTLKEQHPEAGPPIAFVATSALVLPARAGSAAHNIALFDEKRKQAADVTLIERADHTLVLMGVPLVRDGTLVERLQERAADAAGAHAFAKAKGAWTEQPLPKQPPPSCEDVLRSEAKALYIAEESYRAEQDKYATSLADIGYASRVEGLVAKVECPTPTTFQATLSLRGGVVRIGDKDEITLVSKCKAGP